jgi:hypothetical protein
MRGGLDVDRGPKGRGEGITEAGSLVALVLWVEGLVWSSAATRVRVRCGPGTKLVAAPVPAR